MDLCRDPFLSFYMVHGAWCMLIYGMKGKSRRAQSWYGFLRSSLCPHASRGLLLAEPHP